MLVSGYCVLIKSFRSLIHFLTRFSEKTKAEGMYQLGRFFFLTSTEQSVELKSVVTWPRASEFAAVTKKRGTVSFTS